MNAVRTIESLRELLVKDKPVITDKDLESILESVRSWCSVPNFNMREAFNAEYFKTEFQVLLRNWVRDQIKKYMMRLKDRAVEECNDALKMLETVCENSIDSGHK